MPVDCLYTHGVTRCAGKVRMAKRNRASVTGDRTVRLTSLHFKLVIAAAVAISISLSAVAGILVVRQNRVLNDEIGRSSDQLRRQILDHGELFSQDAAAALSQAVSHSDIAGLELRLAELRRRDAKISAAFLLDANGTVVAKSAPASTTLSHDDEIPTGMHRVVRDGIDAEYVEFSEPIEAASQSWGALLLRYDFRALTRSSDAASHRATKLIATSTSLAVGAGLLMAAFGLIFTGLVTRSLMRPIDYLTEDAEMIAEGNIDHEIRGVNSRDEFGVLARQFELMRRSIKSYIGKLMVARREAEAATLEEQRLRGEIEKHSQLLETKVRERTADLQETNERLKEYDRLKSEFLSNVSHELRSPLAAISSAAKIVSRYGDDNPRSDKKFSSVIIEESQRLGRLIDDLLDLAKIEAGRVDWNMERIEDAGEILEHVAATFETMFSELSIKLEVTIDRPIPAIMGDRDRLIQVVTNLCGNALKYTPVDGTVHLIARRVDYQGNPGVMLAVQDTGPGIPANQLEHVFERFHQVKESTNANKPKGTGLGLAICREVTAHHQGRIWAEAPETGGTRMVLVLPACGPLDGAKSPAPEAIQPTAC